MTTLKIFMEAKSFCQSNFLEVVAPVASLESLTLDFTNQPRQMEYLSLALVNLFGLYPQVKFYILRNIPLCNDCLGATLKQVKKNLRLEECIFNFEAFQSLTKTLNLPTLALIICVIAID